MTILKLVTIAENGQLLVTGDGEFCASRVARGYKLDFSGIVRVSSDFLDAALKGLSPEQVFDIASNVEGVVADALAAWVERQSQPQVNETTPKPPAGPVRRQASSEPLKFVRTEIEAERFSPTRLAKRLEEELRGYIESAYPLSDPILIEERRRLLNEAADGHLLAQEPYIETTTRYRASSKSYGDLDLSGGVGDLFESLSRTPQTCSTNESPKTILHPGLYEHQAKSLQAFFNDGKDVIVATGTGSGKTECFLLPILGTVWREARERPASFQQRAIRAILLYPMNALVNDQVSRLRLLFGDPKLAKEFPETGTDRRHPLFGQYTGRTPYPGKRSAKRDSSRIAPLLSYYQNLDEKLAAELRRMGRFPAKDLDSFFNLAAVTESVNADGQIQRSYNWKKRLHTAPGDRELLTRHEMIHGAGSTPGHCPDILVTNYSMLEYLLMRPFERPLFQETANWLKQDGNELLLVIDEAHMYRGARGAEVAFLLRRLRARLGLAAKPEKLRVIATSASLGSDEKSRQAMERFAADLTGKRPENFVTITGEREVPKNTQPGNAEFANLLSSISLEDLHQPGNASALEAVLAPLCNALGKPIPNAKTEQELFKALHGALANHPVLNKLISETARRARSLSELSTLLFPGLENSRKATEVLLTLGSLARVGDDEPGLIPTRIHIFFRGLHALFACLNPQCPGRHAHMNQVASLGKLFAQPRTSCDSCAGRVLELTSCRNCGTAFLRAYTNETPDKLTFLWSESEGHVTEIQLSPTEPRYVELAEEFRIDWSTGYLDPNARAPGERSRSLWMPRTSDGRQFEFAKCPHCQPSGGREKSRISDFRTRGEQPFTVLVETQFAEQPPQKADTRLPNRGRKVLVFSDGRQKAARLAPALDQSHARDLFRQVMALAVRAMEDEGEPARLSDFYSAVMWVCVSRGIDLFPDADEKVFHNNFHQSQDLDLKDLIRRGHRGLLKPDLSYANALFSELTDRFYSLPALGLGVVEEDPLIHSSLNLGNLTCFDTNQALTLLRVWLRLQLERRRFLPSGGTPDQVGQGWLTPEGLDFSNDSHLMPGRFAKFVDAIVNSPDDAAKVKGWLKDLVQGPSGLFALTNNLYYLQVDSLVLRLRLDLPSLRCCSCSRLFAESLADKCPACLGPLVETEMDYLDARCGFYRRQLERALKGQSIEPFGLLAAEHSAQLTGLDDEAAFTTAETHELRFQDLPLIYQKTGRTLPPIDVLSCTTTMEVGIDIGTLCGVALRNVPPQVSNYQQRSGRAGRRGRSVASVLTFAHGSSHDAEFFQHPDRIISGNVLAPVVYVENQEVLARHINAYLVQRFFHEQVTGNENVYKLTKSLGTVEQFLDGNLPCSLEKLESWLNSNASILLEELRSWAPAFSFGRGESGEEVEGLDQTIDSSISRLLKLLKEHLPISLFPQREQLKGLEREALERLLTSELLETLIGRAVFPRYAFPLDVVTFWVTKKKSRGDRQWKREFDYTPQRDLQIALTEYAPGSSLTIDKWRYRSAAIYSPYQPSVASTLDRQQVYVSCQHCEYVSLKEVDASQARCPVCGEGDLQRQPFIVPDGFAPDINAKLEPDRGQGASYAGRTTRAQLQVQESPKDWDSNLYEGRLRVVARSQNLVVVNKGVDDGGFLVCPDCGRTEPRAGRGEMAPTLIVKNKPKRHAHPVEQGQTCDGHAKGPYFLGHKFPTDVLLMRLELRAPVTCRTMGQSPAARSALTTLVQALSLAATSRLQIDEGELGGGWSPTLEGDDKLFIYFYDLLPGGAGYTKLVQQHLPEVINAAEALMANCDCERSCYSCLRHYSNTWDHGSLDRRLGLALLRYLRDGAIPELGQSEKREGLERLQRVLLLRGHEAKLDLERSGLTVPLVIQAPGAGELWVDLHHPLTVATHGKDAMLTAAFAGLNEFRCLNANDVQTALPIAVSNLNLWESA